MNILGDRHFFKSMLYLAIPIALQNLMSASLNLVSVVLVGQLGEAAIAGVGIANQVFFLLNLLLFGTYSGAAIFAAQYWGKKDLDGLRNTMSISLLLGCSVAAVFSFAAIIFPTTIMGIFTDDSEVLALGAPFLVLNACSYIMMAISFCFAMMARSVGKVRLPMFAGILSLILNTLLSWLLIQGRLGFPSLGVSGAGLATLISRAVELALLTGFIYSSGLPIALGMKEIFRFDIQFFKKYMATAFPVILHEGLWSLAITAYTYIYARMGTQVVAAMNIASSTERMFSVLFLGMGNACAIMVGHRIGEQKIEEAQRDAGRMLLLASLGAVIIAPVLMLSAGSILSLFQVSSEVRTDAANILLIIALLMPIRMFNMISIVGVIRGGGDTTFGFLMEILPQWLIALPLAFLGGLWLKLPIVAVYLLITTEEFIKFYLGLRRYRSRKWIRTVTENPQ